jgi:hypothetical protein
MGCWRHPTQPPRSYQGNGAEKIARISEGPSMPADDSSEPAGELAYESCRGRNQEVEG